MRKLTDKRKAIRKAVLPLLLTMVAILSSGCSDSVSSPAPGVAQTIPTVKIEYSVIEDDEEIETDASSEAETETSPAETSSVTSETVSASEEASSDTEGTEISVDIQTELSEETDTVVSSSTEAESEITTETESEPVPETTQAVTEFIVADDIITESAEDLPIVIYAKSVSSPGDAVEKTATASIDYSNASLGYISASYSGDSKRAKLRIVCNDVTYDHDLSVTGEYEYFPLSQGGGDYRIQIYEQLEGKLYSIVLDLNTSVDIDSDTQTFLYPNKYVWFSEKSKCAEKSAQLCAGKDNVIEKIAAIFTYITDNVSYDYDLAASVTSGYIPNPDSLLAKQKGICFDYASLFAAMARTQNIPTRLVIGYASPDIYHAWNEVYTDETGWITPELLLNEKGYNLVDATFYSSTPDKTTISEYISNDGNYSAIYRY